jgi:PPM family protein phosphatase
LNRSLKPCRPFAGETVWSTIVVLILGVNMNDSRHTLLPLQHASASDIGARESNQDSFGSASKGPHRLFVVSDGAGGHTGGALASSLAVEAAIERFEASGESDAGELALACLHAARSSIVTQQRQMTDVRDMTATIVVAILDVIQATVSVVHLGDSRCYTLRRGRVVHTTRDHSLVQGLIDAGMWPAERLLEHPQRSVLYAALGSEEEPEPANLAIDQIALQDGDALLLCSDGWWECVSNARIEQALMQSTTADEWITQMLGIVQTSDRRGRDNSTAIGIWVGEPHHVTLQPFLDTVPADARVI